MVSRDKERLEELQKLMSRLPEYEAKVVFEKFGIKLETEIIILKD